MQTVLGMLCLAGAVVGTVMGWRLVRRLAAQRRDLEALGLELHTALVAARHSLLGGTFELGRKAERAAAQVDLTGRDLAALALGRVLVRVMRARGRSDLWGPVVARVVVDGFGRDGRGALPGRKALATER